MVAAAKLCLYLAALAIAAPPTTSSAFLFQPCSRAAGSIRRLAFSQDGSSHSNQGSRLEGNRRDPTPQELSVMDEMIDRLADAKPYDLPNAVRRAFRVISSPRFFMRIAARADQAESGYDRERLSALANNLVSTIEAVVSTTTDQLDERAKQVQSVVQQAAEPDTGEFLVPLLPQRVQAMRAAMEQLDSADLDEGFLSTIEAWIQKSHRDGMDGMVGILQQALQMYAALQIQRSRPTTTRTRPEEPEQIMASDDSAAAALLLDQLLGTDAESWDRVIYQADAEIRHKALALVQRTTESLILSLETGSFAQRVQAEYLAEINKRLEAAISSSRGPTQNELPQS
jgi:hypothetical protein